MDVSAEYLFWSTANFLIVKDQYRILHISKDQQEIWLEKVENKESQLYRLLCTNLDWSQTLQRDIENVAVNSNRIKRKLTRGNLTITNLYFTPFPPVDDYEFRVEKPNLL